MNILKLSLVLIALGMVAMMASCASAPAAREQTPSSSLPAVAESPAPLQETPKVKKAVTKTVVVQIPRILRDETRYSDNSLSQLVVSNYDSTGNLIKEETFNQKKQLVSRKVLESSADGRQQLVITYNQSNEIQGIAQRLLDPSGRVIQEQLLNNKKELESVSEFTWDASGNPISWISRARDRAVVVSTKYTIKGGKVQNIELYDGSDTLIRRFDQTWNELGQMIKKTDLDPSGRILSFVEYTYRDGLLEREDYRRANSVLVRSIVYGYDDRKLPVQVQYLDRQGQLTELHKQDFQLFDRTETITVYE